MTRCPSELDLERALAGVATPAVERHVAACSRCAAQIAEMRGIGEEFQRDVFPRTVDSVVTRSARAAAPRWVVVAAPASLLAAAAAVFLVVRPAGEYVGIKGRELGIAVFVADGGAARAVSDGEQVPSGAAIRFSVSTARPCRLWVVSADATGQVSRLFPPSGDAGAELTTSGPLPGGAVLDGRSGPERIFAVCSPAAVPYAAVEHAARDAAAGGESGVRSGRRLDGLRDAAQATLLLEKTP